MEPLFLPSKSSTALKTELEDGPTKGLPTYSNIDIYAETTSVRALWSNSSPDRTAHTQGLHGTPEVTSSNLLLREEPRTAGRPQLCPPGF